MAEPTIYVRVSDAQKNVISRAAEEAGESITSWSRSKLLEAATNQDCPDKDYDLAVLVSFTKWVLERKGGLYACDWERFTGNDFNDVERAIERQA